MRAASQSRRGTHGRSRRGPAKNATTGAYEAAANTRRTFGWRAPEISPNNSVLGTLDTLRNRSRAAVRNDGYAFGAVDHLVSNIIGTGIKPLSQVPDTVTVAHPFTGAQVPLRQALHELWCYWTDESDADGLLDFYGQQTQIVRAWLEGGEAFVRTRPRFPTDGLSVPLQVQIIEPEQCPHQYNDLMANGNRVRAGIEFNPIGKRVAYYFYPSRPGDLVDFDRSRVIRITSDVVQHVYEPLRPGQLRGLPHLTRALIRLFGVDKMDDATLMRQQLANLFVAFLSRGSTVADTDTINPLTGLAPETEDGKDMLSLEPGIFQELNPGEEVKWSDPPDPTPAYGDFMRQQLYHVSAATGVPYELLTGDLSRVNDRTVRVILNEFRRRVMMHQHQIVVFKVCKPIWRAWLDRVYLSGVIEFPPDYEENPEQYAAVRWVPQGWPYLNPVQDIEAQKLAVRAGLDSRSNLVSEQGEDAEAIDAQQAADNTRADKLGLRYDSDGRQPSAGPKESITDAITTKPTDGPEAVPA